MSQLSNLRMFRVPWITTLAVWAFLFVVALRTTPSAYAVADALAIAALYLLLAGALVAGARAAGQRGRIAKLVSTLIVGLVLAWHLREQTRVEGAGATLWTLEGLLTLLSMVIALTVILAVLELFTVRRRGGDSGSALRQVAGAALATMMFFVLLAGVYFGTNTGRWHLIRHNRMIGTAAFHLFGRPVADIESADWERHGQGAPIGQPPWVYDLYHGVPGTESATVPSASPPTAPLPTAEGTRPPDIIFVMLDTLRADALREFGGEPQWMPTLNRLADDSLLFTDVIANSSWTRPSIASFFTGLVPEEHGALSFLFRISPGALTLAELLGSRGYDTAAFVANSVIVDPASGYSRGFDVFEYVVDPPGEYARADTVTERVADWLATNVGSVGPDGSSSSGVSGGPSLGDIGNAAERPPLFLYVHYLDPHIPYMSTPEEGAEILPTSNQGIWRYYEDELRFLDAELARLFATLDREMPGPRLMLVASDHGEEFGEHGGMGHSQTLYSEVVNIPVIVQARSGAASPPSGRIDATLEGRDFFDLLLRSGVEGIPDVPEWARQAARAERFSSLSFTKNPGRSRLIHYLIRPYRHRIYNRMVQRGDRRLIWSAFGQTEELYDLASDPGEVRNIAGSQPELVRSMLAALGATPPYWVRPAPVDLSRDRIEELRALGYIR